MKLRILSDGTAIGTKVVNEAGEMVEGVISINWEIGILDEESKVQIIVLGVPIAAEGEGEIMNKGEKNETF